jgi:hypothetical protein
MKKSIKKTSTVNLNTPRIDPKPFFVKKTLLAIIQIRGLIGVYDVRQRREYLHV